GVLRFDGSMQVRRIVKHLEVKGNVTQRVVRRRADLKHIVHPGKVAVGACATELRTQCIFFDLGAACSSKLPDDCFGADVLERHALVFVDEEDAAFRRLDQFLDLMNAQIAIEATFLRQSVRLIHHQNVEGTLRGLGEGAGSTKQIDEVSVVRSLDEL